MATEKKEPKATATTTGGEVDLTPAEGNDTAARQDETVPGGRYLGANGQYHDSEGNRIK